MTFEVDITKKIEKMSKLELFTILQNPVEYGSVVYDEITEYLNLFKEIKYIENKNDYLYMITAVKLPTGEILPRFKDSVEVLNLEKDFVEQGKKIHGYIREIINIWEPQEVEFNIDFNKHTEINEYIAEHNDEVLKTKIKHLALKLQKTKINIEKFNRELNSIVADREFAREFKKEKK
jgi:hypothetical protein